MNPRLRALELVCGEKGFAARELRDVISVLEYTIVVTRVVSASVGHTSRANNRHRPLLKTRALRARAVSLEWDVFAPCDLQNQVNVGRRQPREEAQLYQGRHRTCGASLHCELDKPVDHELAALEGSSALLHSV